MIDGKSLLTEFTAQGMALDLAGPITEAEVYDNKGQHNEALDVLLKATRKNHLDAATALGKRMFYGDRCPQSFKEGARILQIAGSRGGGEANCQNAALHAMGLFPQSWQKAIELLVVSAKTGWKPAQGQLIALCEEDVLAEEALQGAEEIDWELLAQTVNLKKWLTAGSKVSLSQAPTICTLEKFVSPRCCDWIIAQALPNMKRAEVYDAHLQQDIVNETRTNSLANFSLQMSDVASLLIQNRIALTLGSKVSHMEPISVLHYKKGQEITPHFDFIHPDSANHNEEVENHGQRKVTFIIYLNEGYLGGNTEFPKLGIENAGKQGDAIFFVNMTDEDAPDFRTLHSGNPISEGEKWIITQFVREKVVININI